MHKLSYTFVIFAMLFMSSCEEQKSKENYSLSSPDEKNTVTFSLTEAGKPTYTIAHDGVVVVDTSAMGFDLKDLDALSEDFEIIKTETSTADETWQMPWGEQLEVRNHYNELIIYLQETSENKRNLNIHFKAYNDGIGFYSNAFCKN